MAVTSHFIGDDWKLWSRILRFAYVPCPHTKEVLAKVLMDTLYEYSLETKISSVVVDNCTTNDAMMEILGRKFDSASLILSGDFLHMRCSAHILNLIVKDGLEIINEALEVVRDNIAFWLATPKSIEAFNDSARSLKVFSNKSLILDCKTRWNSTYLMLQTAFPLLYQNDNSSDASYALSSENVKVSGYRHAFDIPPSGGNLYSQHRKNNKKRKVNVRSELDWYLEDEPIPDNNSFDILGYWKNTMTHPTLRQMAKDILAIPVSSVASESAFNTGGRVLTPHRARLHAKTVEAVMCLQSWMVGDHSASSMQNAYSCATVLEDSDLEGSCVTDATDPEYTALDVYFIGS